MKIPAERLVYLTTTAAKNTPGQVYGQRDMFCVRNSQTREVEASGFANKMEAKYVRDVLNGVRRKISEETKRHIPWLVVSRGVHHWRGPSCT